MYHQYSDFVYDTTLRIQFCRSTDMHKAQYRRNV